MRAIWKGNISFALVTIPISVFSATRSNDVSFKYLHKKDLSPVSYKRFCDAEGQEVPWEEITRGYEFEKGRFVGVTEEEFKQANVELSRTIQIIAFVDENEIDPVYYEKPYYLEPQKGGEHAYALLGEALKRSGRVGVARVVLKSREHLALLKPSGKLLTLQTMRFAHEVADHGELNIPEETKISAKEMSLANMLIETMQDSFDPATYKDEYRGKLLEIIQKKVEGVEVGSSSIAPGKPGQTIDLMEVLKQSLEATKKPQRRVREKTVATRPSGAGKKTRAKKKA